MNQDVFAGKWKQIRGELKSWWGKLAEDDFDRIGGQKDKLIGVIQEKYGYAREKAQREVEERLKEYGDTMDGPSGNGKRDAVPHEGAIATAKTAAAEGLEWAEGAIATAKTAVAEGVESAQGAIATAKTAVAGGVESAKVRSPRRRQPWRRGWNRRVRICKRENSKIWQPTSPP